MSVPPPPRKFFPPGSAPPAPAPSPPATAAATEAPAAAAEPVAAAPAAPAPATTTGGPPPPPPGGPKATPPPPPPGGPSTVVSPAAAAAAAPAASGVPPPPPPSAAPAAAAPTSPAPPAIPTASRPPPPTPPPKPSMARPTPPHPAAAPATLDVPASDAQGPASPAGKPAPPPRVVPSSPAGAAAAASPRVVPNSPAAGAASPAASPAPQSSMSPPPSMPTINESQAGHSGSTLSPPTPGRGSFAAGLPNSPGSGRGSFSGGPAPGELGAKRASISHRPSLSMGSNGVMMPVKKEVSVNDMQQSIASQSPEEVAQALLDSEGEYVEGLKVCLDSFCLRLRNHIVLKRDLLTEMEILQLFGNIANIKNFNSTLYHDLVALYDESPQALLTGLGKVMIRFIPFFKLYTDYVKHHRENARMLTNKRQGSKDVEFFIQLNELSTGRNFQALLSSPANRLAQYLVYMGDIYAKIPHDTEVAHEYEEAIRKIQKVTDDIADFLKDQTARRLVVTVQCKLFDNTIEVVSSSRTVAKYGKVKVISDNLIGSGHSTEKVVLVLMNDMLLYGETATKLSKGKCKVVLQLSGMFAENFGNNQAAAKAYNDVPIDRCFRILTRSHKPLLFQCESTNARDQWLVALQETIDKYSSVMKRSIAPDQLQIACMSAEDFERTVLKKKVDKKAIAEAAEKASKMAQSNKANPLPESPPSQTRRLGGSVSGPSSPPPQQRAAVPAAPAAPVAPASGAPPPPPPMAPAVGPVTGSSAPPAPPMAPVLGSSAPAAPPMAPPMAPSLSHAPPPPLPSSGGPPPAPGPPSAPGAPPAPSPSASASKPVALGPNRNDLLSSIQKGGGLASLKKVDKNAPPPGSHAPPPLPGASGASSPIAALSSPSSSGAKSGVDLNAALKSSLDRYRQFVQDEEEDDMDEWDE